MSQAENVLETSLNSSGSAMKEQEEYMKGIEYSASRLKTAFQELSSNTISSDFIKGFFDISTSLVEAVDAVGLLPTLLSTVVGLMSGFKNIGRAKLISLPSI